MPRPRHATPHKVIEHPIPIPLLLRLDAVLTPPGATNPPPGARAKVINGLLNRFVAQREIKMGEEVGVALDKRE